MDWLKFISSIVESIAWPVATFMFALLLRRPLEVLLPQLKKLKYKDWEAEFNRDVKEVEQELVQLPVAFSATLPESEPYKTLNSLAQIVPNAAISEAWKVVESAAKDLIANRGLDLDYNVPAPYRLIGRVLAKGNLIDPKKVKIFNDLRKIRNKAAHAADYEVTSDQASEYIDLALELAAHFQVELLDEKNEERI